ncbi:MAG: hypothetical protein WKG03_21330 [Telluria sp.]
MWKRCKSNARLLVAVGVMLAASASSHATHVVVGDLKKYRTSGSVHGMFEINAEAKKFLRAENRTHHTDWVALGPDLRMQVERCLVPLRSRWARVAEQDGGPAVMVICRKSIQKRPWDILVHALPGSPQVPAPIR